jgi:hypothetical protein
MLPTDGISAKTLGAFLIHHRKKPDFKDHRSVNIFLQTHIVNILGL